VEGHLLELGVTPYLEAWELQRSIAAELRRNGFKGDLVGDSFDEDDSHVRKLA